MVIMVTEIMFNSTSLRQVPLHKVNLKKLGHGVMLTLSKSLANYCEALIECEKCN